jgi:hypothetical protein
MKSNAHQKIYEVKGGKKKEHMIEVPLANSINLKEDCLKEEKEKPDPDYFSQYHHKEVRPVGHLTHQSDLDEKKKYFKITLQGAGMLEYWNSG